jgi:7SK snRNA methylphosphate capping enzyme
VVRLRVRLCLRVSEKRAERRHPRCACSFSVTKWIHLFHGDEGIKKVFAKIYELLSPGGRLVLEPQPWKSYHKRKFTSEVTAANYPKIQLRPKDFPKYLVETVGFRSCEFLEVCQTSAKGFRRPVYVAQK